MNWKNAELNNAIKVGAIGFLLWSFISLFRLFPLNLDIIIPIAIITIVYWLVEVGIIIHFDHYLIILATIIVYTIFSALFFFIGQIDYLYVSYVAFGMLLPKLTRIKGEPEENKKQSGFHAAGIALGFSLSIIGFTSGLTISSLNSFIVLLVGAVLGCYVIISSREDVKRELHFDKRIIKKGFVYFLGSLAIGMAIFLGISVYINPVPISYFTGLDYEYILILVMISFALAGIVCVFFEKLIARFENRIVLIFILLNCLGLVGFLLILFVQSIPLIVLLIIANISLYLGISIAFHLLSKLNLKWSFTPFFTLSFGMYGLIIISGVTYFYLLALIVQLGAILFLNWLVKEE